MKKISFWALLAPLLVGCLMFALKMPVVKAVGTVYIRADGSIDPPTVPISTVDNVTYTFTGSISDSIVVERNNITLEGNGFCLQGAAAGRGIDLTGRTNVTITGIQIKNFSYGIWLNYSSSNTISDSKITYNTNYGIQFVHSDDNTVSENSIIANDVGVFLEYSCSYNHIGGNNITKNEGYAVGMSFSCSHNTVVGNNITDNGGGVGLSFSFQNFIDFNRITNNSGGGIQLYYSCYGNYVSGNNITADGNYGVKISGTQIYPTHDNYIDSNDITNNFQGIWLDNTSTNGIMWNNITDNGLAGIRLVYSTTNMFQYNFFDNSQQILIDAFSHSNFWGGYPEGGNCWSDYSGPDLYSGVYQNEAGSDGLGDLPYVIDPANQDISPLMKPYGGINDTGITSITISKEVVGQSYSSSIAVRILNYGGNYLYTENVNISVYANTTAIASQIVALARRNSTTLTFTWNTTGFAKENYMISAYASPVTGETDTADNNFTDGTVHIGIPGDINGDSVVDSTDLGMLGVAWGSFTGDLNYEPDADLDDSGVIDSSDLGIMGAHWGETE